MAGFDTNGVLIDVSNNAGKLDEAAFEVSPFAVGVATNLAPGVLAPIGTKLSFELNLNDPLVEQYLQEGLNADLLRFVASSLLEAIFQNGAPNYPQFYTRDNLLAATNEVPLLDLEVELIGGPNVDSQPSLQIARAQYGKVRLVWTVPVEGELALEASAALSNPQWAVVTDAPQVENGTASVILEADGSKQFFRLHKVR